jgi:hypothetical protein
MDNVYTLRKYNLQLNTSMNINNILFMGYMGTPQLGEDTKPLIIDGKTQYNQSPSEFFKLTESESDYNCKIAYPIENVNKKYCQEFADTCFLQLGLLFTLDQTNFLITKRNLKIFEENLNKPNTIQLKTSEIISSLNKN